MNNKIHSIGDLVSRCAPHHRWNKTDSCLGIIIDTMQTDVTAGSGNRPKKKTLYCVYWLDYCVLPQYQKEYFSKTDVNKFKWNIKIWQKKIN